MPQLEHVFSAPSHSQVLPLLDDTYLMQLAEASLSASYFRDESWKVRAVTIATDAANTLGGIPEKEVYLALTAVRRASLAHLYRPQGEWHADKLSFPIYDHRSNALSSQPMILKARENISLNALASALEHLKPFTPAWGGATSTLGSLQNQQVALMRAKTLRCEGRFQQAYEILLTFTPGYNKVGLQLGYVLCELGKFDEAIRELDSQLLAAAGHPKNTTLIQLALANAHLVKHMHVYSKGQRSDWRMLQKSRDIYQGLRAYTFPATYFGKINQLSALIGLAIADHLDGQVDSALEAWQAVSTASQAFLPTGYTDMIFAYSTSELQMRRGNTVQSDMLMNYAKALFARVGRQHHFVGLGSYWPDMINAWVAAQDREPLVPLRP